MNNKEIRRLNLRILAEEVGSLTQLAHLIDRPPSFLSRLIGRNPSKNIGDQLAGNIEAAFNKPAGWLDQLPSNNLRKINGIPLLDWRLIPYCYKSTKPYHGVMVFSQTIIEYPLSEYAFALKIKDNSMEAPCGITFPTGSIIVVEPEAVLKEGCFVIVATNVNEEPFLRQYDHNADGPILKLLNSTHPPMKLLPHYRIYGIVRYLLQLF